jgi:hypothetical protein
VCVFFLQVAVDYYYRIVAGLSLLIVVVLLLLLLLIVLGKNTPVNSVESLSIVLGSPNGVDSRAIDVLSDDNSSHDEENV